MTDTTSTTNKGELLWLDMETLGLDPAKGQILEVAAVLTDMRANEEINRFSALLPLDEKADVPVWNAITHGGPGGLLSLCAGISRPEQDQAQWTRALDALDLCLVTMVAGCERAPILAGSSVHFDRRWIDAYLPQLSKRLSYRHLDVRAVLMAHAAAGVDHELGKPKAGKLEAAHRAEADIDYSIELYRRALSWISNAPHTADSVDELRRQLDTRTDERDQAEAWHTVASAERDELRRKVDELRRKVSEVSSAEGHSGAQPLAVWPECDELRREVIEAGLRAEVERARAAVRKLAAAINEHDNNADMFDPGDACLASVRAVVEEFLRAQGHPVADEWATRRFAVPAAKQGMPLAVWPERVKVTRSAPLEPCPFCGAKQGMYHVKHCPEIGRDALTEGPSSVRLTGAEDDFCEVCGRAPCDMADEAKGHSGVRLAGGA